MIWTFFLLFAFMEFDVASFSHQCNPCSQLNTYLLAISSTSFAAKHSSFLSQNDEQIIKIRFKLTKFCKNAISNFEDFSPFK
jgi:hypothetical protein